MGAKRRRAEEPEKMVYIPLLDTLEAVLLNRNIIAEVHITLWVHHIEVYMQNFGTKDIQ